MSFGLGLNLGLGLRTGGGGTASDNLKARLNGQADLEGTLQGIPRNLAGSLTGSANSVGDLSVIKELTGSLTGSADLVGDLPVASLLLDNYPAAAAYSTRQLSSTSTNAIRVRRDSDNAEQDIGFVDGSLDTTSLENFVNNYSDILPLDTSSAAAAYSLRYVGTAYTGNVVRVRRDSDNAELDFNPTELTDGTLATFCGVNNGYVTTWYDQSGNGYNATQATAANQPKIYDSATGLVLDNGKPAMQFISANPSFLTSSVTITAPLTAFMVARTTGLTNDANLFFDSDSSARMLIAEDSTSFLVQADDTAAKKISISKNTNTNLFYFLSNTANSALAINGNTATTGDIGSNNVLNGLTIGSIRPVIPRQPYSLNGFMQEFIIYPTDQSGNRTAIEGNINKYYDIYSANGYVTTWYDQSGNGYNATQSTAANQPKIYDSTTGLVTENGKPALSFDGLTDYLTNSLAISGTFTNFFVGTLSDNGDFNFIYDTNGAKRVRLGTWQPSGGAYFADNGTGAIAQSLISNDGTQKLLYAQHTTSDVSISVNNESLITNSTTSSGSTSSWVIGARNDGADHFLLGALSELVIYDTDQSSNRTAIEADINTFYSIY